MDEDEICYPPTPSSTNHQPLSTIQNPTSTLQTIFNFKLLTLNCFNHQPPSTNHHSPGHTILELITAIIITLIISTLIFAAYLAIFKEFNLFTRKADAVMEAVVVKKRMDALFNEIKTVTATYKTTVEYLNEEKNKKHTLTFRNNALYLDNALKVTKLSSFEYTVTEKKGGNERQLLLWEAVLSNSHWIAGANEVYVE